MTRGTQTQQPVALLTKDVADAAGCTDTTVRRISDELGLAPLRTPRGVRLFSSAEAQQIVAEVRRRRAEALR